MQGHVDGTGTVDRMVKTAEQHVVWIKPEAHLGGYMIPKGSVAIDGVSLTIAAVEGELFSVALIPTTLERTTFSRLSVGDSVNLESDIIARTIVHHLHALSEKGGITLETLKSAGFA